MSVRANIAHAARKEAEQRFDNLDIQKEAALKMKAQMEAFMKDVEDCEWEGAIASLEDVISCLSKSQDTIEDWTNQKIDDDMAGYGDHVRDMAMDR